MDVFEFDYYQRLKKDYNKHKSLFVAFDYDNTVHDYHNLNIDYTAIIELLRTCEALGFVLILFTASEGEDLKVVLNDLKKRNIPYHHINENPIMDTRKPYYNILLDDRAGLKESFDQLKKLTDEIRNNKV